ncbi:ABC-2 family transporter protein [Candidatus Dojkabacteria bacterium]|nr:ABC-2 family transporter protein [Candidatus Dojkabacteria bacterium]
MEIVSYRISFFVELAVEFGYQGAHILFFNVIFSNIKELAGWSYHEMLFLAGINVITSEVLLGALSIFNLRRLPEKIRTGALDAIILRPLNSLFQASLGHPYIMSFISTISGFFLMFYAISHSDLSLNTSGVFAGIFLLACGFIIGFSILVISASFSFLFINTPSIPSIGEHIFFYKSNPHHVYEGALKVIFFYIFPVVFVSSIPAYTMMHGPSGGPILIGGILAIVFLFAAITFWNKMIKHYSSASS